MTDSACPEVSVILPTFNVSPFIGAAIESVLQQNFSNFELLVMDDGSSDDTVDIARSFNDPRVTVYPREHRGPTHSMNEAIKLARGRWLAFLDGDDTWAPAKLQRHVEHMIANPELDLTFCRSRMIDEQGNNLHITSPRWKGTLSYRQLLISNPAANGSSIFVDREALLRAGYFDTSFSASYDHELWLRVALLRPDNMACIPETLTYYRRRSGQITADPYVMEQGWRQLIDKHRQLNPEIVNALEPKSRSNLCRYLAAIAYECGEIKLGLHYIKESLVSAPLLFLRTGRSYLVTGALLARGVLGGLLPGLFQRRL